MTDSPAADAVSAHAEFLAERLQEADALKTAFERALHQRLSRVYITPSKPGDPQTYKVTCAYEPGDRLFRLTFWHIPRDLEVQVDIGEKELTAATTNVERFVEWVGHWLTLVDAEHEKLRKDLDPMKSLGEQFVDFGKSAGVLSATMGTSVEDATKSLKAVAAAFPSKPSASDWYETERSGRPPRTFAGAVTRPLRPLDAMEKKAQLAMERVARERREEQEALESIKRTISSDECPDQ